MSAVIAYDAVGENKFHISNRCEFPGREMAHDDEEKLLSIGFKPRL